MEPSDYRNFGGMSFMSAVNLMRNTFKLSPDSSRMAVARFLVRLLLIVTVLSGFTLAKSDLLPQAIANSANPGVSSTGYIYSTLVVGGNDVGIQRYSIKDAIYEEINMSDASCTTVLPPAKYSSNSFFDFAVDGINSKIFWSNTNSSMNVSQINEINLKTGVCKTLVESTNTNYYQYFGIALDETNQILYFLNNTGFKSFFGQNKTLNYIDLKSESLQSSSIILLEDLNTSNESVTVGNATDIILVDSSTIIISGRQFESGELPRAGDSIFEVKVRNGGNLLNASTVREIMNWRKSNPNSIDIYQIALENDKLYFNVKNNSGYEGVYRIPYNSNGNALYIVNGLDTPTSVTTSTYNQSFAIGRTNEIFTMGDGLSGQAWFFEKPFASPTISKTKLTQSDNSLYGYWPSPVYDSREFPKAPTIRSSSRSPSETSTVIGFLRPSDFDADGSYTLIAIPDTVTAGITETVTILNCLENGSSACTFSGLTAGMPYTFKIKHNWRSSSGVTIVSSSFSPNYREFLPIIDRFEVYENTANRFTYRSPHESITAQHVDESVVPWVSAILDQDVRDLSSASEYVTFEWFVCNNPQSQNAVSHISFDDLLGNCSAGGYTDLYSYADSTEVGKYTTLGVHAKNTYGSTYTLQSRSTVNANAIIFDARFVSTANLTAGSSLTTTIDDLLLPSRNPGVVNEVGDALSVYDTGTVDIGQRWYRCAAQLPESYTVLSTVYYATNSLPSGCTEVGSGFTTDPYTLTTDDYGTYIVSAITATSIPDSTTVTQLVSAFIPAPALTVTAISPSSGSTLGGTSVTITGTGFFSGATVAIGSVNCGSVVIQSTTTLTCNTGAKSAGTYSVVVTNRLGQSATLSAAFTYNQPANQVSPAPPVVEITKQTPVIAWNPSDIYEGDEVTFANPLNATFSVPGSATYSITSGTKPAVGPLTISVSFTPNDASNYRSLVATRTIQVLAKPTPSPTPSPTPKPSASASQTPNPSPSPSSTPSPSASKASPSVTPKPSKTTSRPSPLVPTPVTLNQVKGSFNAVIDPNSAEITINVASFPVKTSSTSKLMAVATNMATGAQITANFSSKSLGSEVVLNGFDGGSDYKVELLYISTKGEIKTLQTKYLKTPATKPVIASPTKSSGNSALVKVQGNGSATGVRVYIGKVQPTPSPSPSKSVAAPTVRNKVRVYISKVEK